MTQKSYSEYSQTVVACLSLFTSAGTLLCCALPALLVSLGMGAVMAGLTANVPALMWVSAHKKGVFIAAALLLCAAGWMLWQARLWPCPADAQKAKACRMLRKLSVFIYGISCVFYAIGFFFAFLAVKLLP